MRKVLALIFAPLIMCVCFVPESDAAALSFRNFTAGRGVTVSVPYKVNAGTRDDPDTVTLAVNLAAPVLEFQLTVVGSDFPGGDWCELEWKNERLGAPGEENVPLVDAGFTAVQHFRLNPAQLNLTPGGTRRVLYELEADEEPYLTLLDTKRRLLVTFAGAEAPAVVPLPPDGGEIVKAVTGIFMRDGS